MIHISETYTYSGAERPEGGRVTAQRMIKTGDTVRITFLGTDEREVRITRWDPYWETEKSVPVIGESYYFEVVVNDKRSYYGKYAYYRDIDTKEGDDRAVLRECDVTKALADFKQWLEEGAKGNCFWHSLYRKTDFPETVAYGMPGEQPAAPVAEAVWRTGEVIDEGEGIFMVDGIRYQLRQDGTLTVIPLRGGGQYAGEVHIPTRLKYRRRWRTVSYIQRDAFDGPDLERIVVDADNPTYTSVDGVLYTKDLTTLYTYPRAHGESFVLPPTVLHAFFKDAVRLRSVTLNDVVVDFSFSGCSSLTSVHVPGSVRTVSRYTFTDCTALQSVSFGEGVTKVWAYAFEGCTSLRRIVFPSSMEEVEDRAFWKCEQIEDIVFPEGKLFDFKGAPRRYFPWGQDPFVLDGVLYRPGKTLVVGSPKQDEAPLPLHPEVQTLAIPAEIVHNGFTYQVTVCESSFSQFPNLHRLELPATMQHADLRWIASLTEVAVDSGNPYLAAADGMLYSKDMKHLLGVPRAKQIRRLTLPDGVEVIGNERSYSHEDGFSEKIMAGHEELQEIVLPDSVRVIGEFAFTDCTALRSLHLGEGVEEIHTQAFANTALQTVRIPQSLKDCGFKPFSGWRPFHGCSALTAFEMDGESNLLTVMDGVLYRKTRDGLELVYCPTGYTGELRIPDGVVGISHDAVSYCTQLESVVMPDSLLRIGDWAFRSCSALRSVRFSRNVRKIGYGAFAECTSLAEADLSHCTYYFGYEDVNRNIFMNCKNAKLLLPPCLEDERKYFERYMNE